MLQKTQRAQTHDGKAQNQVASCVLRASEGRVTTTCLVKDGLSSLSRFSTEYDSDGSEFEGTFVVTDIDRLIGVLRYHGVMVTLTQTHDKLRVKSNSKQTTLDASPQARVHPSNPATVLEWEQNSRGLVEAKLDIGNNLYHLEGGGSKEAFAWYEVDANDLFEAFRCDSMNRQKNNEYLIEGTQDLELYISTGLDLKGTTRTLIPHAKGQPTWFKVVVKGGMEQLFSKLNGDITVKVFDFTNEGQGYKVLFDLGNGDFVFQSGILR